MRNHLSLLGGALLVTLGLASGCDELASAPAEPEPTPADSALPAALDLTSYCQTVCTRAASCGLREAEQRAGAAEAEREALERAKREQPALTRSCIEGCVKEGPADARSKERALICYRREDCGELRSCLEAL